MTYTPDLTRDTRIGVERDKEAWLLDNDAFPDLQDCYIWRGRILKRKANELLGRLNILIGTTDGSGDLTSTVIFDTSAGTGSPVNMLGGISYFVIGTDSYQNSTGATLLVTGTGTPTLSLSAGTFAVTGAPATTAVYYYPGLPVMGLCSLEQSTANVQTLIAFDTAFSYIFNSGNFSNISFYWETTTPVQWTGTNSDLFWAYTYANCMWTTNGNYGFQSNPVASTDGMGDGIRWLDEAVTSSTNNYWVNFLPPLDTVTNYLMGALMIVPYKDRLVVLNTVEGPDYATPTFYRQRARWCSLTGPFYTTPVPSLYPGDDNDMTWYSTPGNGGSADAPTNESIVSCEFVKDTLIVYFERSTWRLAYTSNFADPFVWEKINTELGAESTFSVVPFDDFTMAVGTVGIHACDSVTVKRIDQKIPDEVFRIQISDQGSERVYGIRDYVNQLVYWSLPYYDNNSEPGATQSSPIVFPNKLLVYNYIDNSFSFFNDCYTAFGYVQQATVTPTVLWSSPVLWGSDDTYWGTIFTNPEALNVCAGNAQGFVELIMNDIDELNDPSLFIANVSGNTVTSPNHSLQPNQFVQITSASGLTQGNGAIFKIASVPTSSTFTLDRPTIGTYTGNGLLTVLNQYSILTKKFNPYIDQGCQVRIGRVDFYFDRTSNGQVTVNLYVDDDTSIPVNAPDDPPISTISSVITAITASPMSGQPTAITVVDGTQFSQNNVVYITDVVGMTQINILSGIVTSVSGNVVSVSIDSSTFSAYTSGGILWNVSRNTFNGVNTFGESTYQNSADTRFVIGKIWKRLQLHDISQLFQLQITLSEIQMKCPQIVGQNITLHAFMPYFNKAGRLIYE